MADLTNFAAVGSGVHIHAAAHRTGNAVGEFHTGQPQICREHRRPGHGHPRHHPNVGIVQLLHAIQAVLQADNQPPDALVRRQYVGSCA